MRTPRCLSGVNAGASRNAQNKQISERLRTIAKL
jgi:hypothetical protein